MISYETVMKCKRLTSFDKNIEKSYNTGVSKTKVEFTSKKLCRGLCADGSPCKSEAVINGLCIMHYWKEKERKK